MGSAWTKRRHADCVMHAGRAGQINPGSSEDGFFYGEALIYVSAWLMCVDEINVRTGARRAVLGHCSIAAAIKLAHWCIAAAEAAAEAVIQDGEVAHSGGGKTNFRRYRYAQWR